MFTKLTSLKNHEGFMKYFYNTSWLFGEKILRMLVGLFVGVWVARYLGPEQFGLFSYAGSFVALFSFISTLGLDSIVIRKLVKDESKRDILLGTAFWMKLVGALAIMCAIAIAVNFTSNDTFTNTIIFIIASTTIFQSFNVIDFYFQSKVLSRYVVYANIIGLIISSISKITLILFEAPLIAFVYVALFDSLILALFFSHFYFKNNLSFKTWVFDKITAVYLFKECWPLILSSMVIALYMRIDQVMIKEMLSNDAVGQYSAAVRLSEAWYFIPMVISSSLFPAIINSKKQSEELYYTRLQKLYDLMVWMAIVIAVPMTFMSDWIVKLLYGTKYSEAGSVLSIHIWAGIFVFLGVASGKWFINENLQRLSFWRTLYGMLINIILNFFLIPKYGIQGAAYTTLISQAVAAYLFDFFNSKTRRMFFMKTKTIIPIYRKLWWK